MQDMRRFGAVEAISGGAGAEQLSQAMGNTLSAFKQPFEIYVPVDIASIEARQDARQKDGEKMRRKDRDKTPAKNRTENKESKLSVRFRIPP